MLAPLDESAWEKRGGSTQTDERLWETDEACRMHASVYL